jgi:hypothetical protein
MHNHLLHTIVAMGVALTGGTMTACGGVTVADPGGADGGGDATLDDAPTDHSYPIIDSARRPDGYGTIKSQADGYPVISSNVDSGDGYPIITPVEGDAYPMIGILVDAG